LAKKSRTPPPPRRPIQAPQQRAHARTESERRTLLYLVLFAASGIVILGAVLAFVAFGGSGGGSGSTAVTGSKSCVETSYPGLAPKHLTSPDQKVKYNSFPPSSGPHFQTPAPWGIYTESIQQTIVVHNLEHGGIIVQYGDVGQKAIGQIQSFFTHDPYGLVVAPYPKLGKRIALTAWNEPAYRQEGAFKDVNPGKGYVLMCTAFDGHAFAKFRDAHRNQAGERYPSLKDMAPNTG
jgi:hypothetical protein